MLEGFVQSLAVVWMMSMKRSNGEGIFFMLGMKECYLVVLISCYIEIGGFEYFFRFFVCYLKGIR